MGDDHVAEHAGILTVTVEFALELEGNAARTADSEQEAALQVAVVQDCAEEGAHSNENVEKNNNTEIKGGRSEQSRLMYLWPLREFSLTTKV